MMKRKIVCLPLCISIFISPAVFSMETQSDSAGVLSFMVGDIDVSSNGETWKEGYFDMDILVGDHVRTGEDSRCEVTLSDKTIVRMDENTIQQFQKKEDPTESQKKSIFLSAGKLWLNARKIISKEDSFKVRTNKAVCAIRGTIFSVEERKTYTQVRVLKGEVASWSAILENRNNRIQPRGGQAYLKPYPVKGPQPIAMEEWIEVIKALQQITIDAKGGYEKQDFNLEKISEDPWVEWNMKRDSLMIK